MKPQIRALLVDDDLVDRIACRRALAADDTYDFVLIEAETGGEGLTLVAQEKPDCVLLDYHLPDQTGIEFLAALANDAGEVAVPVMVLTGGDSAAVAAELMRRGARDYLGKDSDQQYLKELSPAIQRMLHAQQVLDAKHQAEAKLRLLAAHQETIKENERKRIAQEIHDELGSLLTGIKAHVSVSIERAVQAGQTPDPLLVDAARLADDAIAAVRRVITDLRPSVLDQLGVWEALAWYANQIEKRADLICECTIDDDAFAVHLDPDRSTMLFRIVQETLTNVQRHAEASHVSIHASRDARGLAVEVRDDGKGIELKDDDPKRQSWGILGMRERARHFGGELTIAGAPGVGTTVVLHLPLESDET